MHMCIILKDNALHTVKKCGFYKEIGKPDCNSAFPEWTVSKPDIPAATLKYRVSENIGGKFHF